MKKTKKITQEIKLKKTSFDKLKVGNYLVNESMNMIGLIIKKDESLIHNHPYIIIRWLGSSGNYVNSTSKTKHFSHNFKRKISVLDIDFYN